MNILLDLISNFHFLDSYQKNDKKIWKFWETHHSVKVCKSKVHNRNSGRRHTRRKTAQKSPALAHKLFSLNFCFKHNRKRKRHRVQGQSDQMMHHMKLASALDAFTTNSPLRTSVSNWTRSAARAAAARTKARRRRGREPRLVAAAAVRFNFTCLAAAKWALRRGQPAAAPLPPRRCRSVSCVRGIVGRSLPMLWISSRPGIKQMRKKSSVIKFYNCLCVFFCRCAPALLYATHIYINTYRRVLCARRWLSLLVHSRFSLFCCIIPSLLPREGASDTNPSFISERGNNSKKISVNDAFCSWESFSLERTITLIYLLILRFVLFDIFILFHHIMQLTLIVIIIVFIHSI